MPISIAFCGTSAFAIPCLEALVSDERFRVTCVITQPDKPVGRKQLLTPPPVKAVAERHKLTLLQPQSLNAEWKTLAATVGRPDFLVAVSYGQILSQEILDCPLKAPVNVHASLLPKLRGASPIQHAILQDMKETGVTVQRMVKELDAGPVLDQLRVDVLPRETAPTLHDKLADAGAKLLIDTLVAFPAEKPQNPADATFCRKLSRDDGVVDFGSMTAQDIDRKVRALTPWPGVTWSGLKFLATALEPDADAMEFECAKGTKLYVTSIQPAGKKPMTGAAYHRGLRLPSP